MNALPLDVEEIQDVVYGNVKGRLLRLNIARRKIASENPPPVIVYIHGGGWSGGTYKGPRNYPFAAEGYFTVNVEYRLSGEAVFPAQIHDCKAAVRWLRAHAEEYAINGGTIGVWGHSAGGHLSALLGTSYDVSDLEGEGGSEGFSSRVQAVVTCAGPTDFSQMIGSRNQLFLDATSKLVGGPLEERHELVKMANPITHIRPDAPPFLIIHGENDKIVPFSQAEFLYDSLRKAGVEATLVKVKKAGHGFQPEPEGTKVEPDAEEIQQMISNFFDKHLRK